MKKLIILILLNFALSNLILAQKTQDYVQISFDKKCKHQWNNNWNVLIGDEINNHFQQFINQDTIYKNDLLQIHPKYYTATVKQKIAIWTLLIVAMAKFESAFDKALKYQENASLNYVFSEGLLQLSYSDEKRYPNAPLNTQLKNIFKPEVNLKTGVIILAKQLEKRQTIFTEKSFYWSVLTNKKEEILNYIHQYVTQIDIL